MIRGHLNYDFAKRLFMVGLLAAALVLTAYARGIISPPPPPPTTTTTTTTTPLTTPIPTTTDTTTPTYELFQKAMMVMPNLDSFSMAADMGPAQSWEGEKSGESYWAELMQVLVIGLEDTMQEYVFTRIMFNLPNEIFYVELHEDNWYRVDIDQVPANYIALLNYAPLVVFPHPDIPMEYYELTYLNEDIIENRKVSHIRVDGNWDAIHDWFESQNKWHEVSEYYSIPLEMWGFFIDEMAFERTVDVWIDTDGFLRKAIIGKSTWDNPMTFSYSDFNMPITIQAPTDYEMGPPPMLQ